MNGEGVGAAYERFSALQGRELVLRTETDDAVPARLTAATLTDPASGSFTLDLVAESRDSDQGTYVLAEREPGGFEEPVFLVPSGRDGSTTTYHAVFDFRAPPSLQEGDQR